MSKYWNLNYNMCPKSIKTLWLCFFSHSSSYMIIICERQQIVRFCLILWCGHSKCRSFWSYLKLSIGKHGLQFEIHLIYSECSRCMGQSWICTQASATPDWLQRITFHIFGTRSFRVPSTQQWLPSRQIALIDALGSVHLSCICS